jgi:hypothetical protein
LDEAYIEFANELQEIFEPFPHINDPDDLQELVEGIQEALEGLTGESYDESPPSQ